MEKVEAIPMSTAAKKQIRVRQAAPKQSTAPFENVRQTSPMSLTFQLSPTHVSYANSLRRAALTLVETVAFRADIDEKGNTADIRFTKNSTPMSNEMFAHRIGLLPVHVSTPLAWKPDEYAFELNVKNESADPLNITAADIRVSKRGATADDPDTMVPSTEFFHPHPISRSTCLLGVLKGRVGKNPAEEVHCTLRATLGNGRENARFIPVSLCAYKYTLDTDEDKRKKVFYSWLESHKKVNTAELEGNPERKGELEREFATMEVGRCFLKDEKGEPYSFDFSIESIGVLTPRYIVARALDILQAKLMKYASIDKGDLPPSLTIQPADARMKGFDFMFQGEDHTLGNLLQTWITENGDTFAGYKVPHPLRDEMLLRIGVEDGLQTTARGVVAAAARGCAEMFRSWRSAWEMIR
jgi:DNA-directed RNA polymerase subunit L